MPDYCVCFISTTLVEYQVLFYICFTYKHLLTILACDYELIFFFLYVKHISDHLSHIQTLTQAEAQGLTPLHSRTNTNDCLPARTNRLACSNEMRVGRDRCKHNRVMFRIASLSEKCLCVEEKRKLVNQMNRN